MYRENIFEFIRDEESTLLIPKNGGLWKYLQDLLPEIGMSDMISIRSIMEGKIRGSLVLDGPDGQKLEVKAVRGEDAPAVANDMNMAGKKTYALTGDDLYDEFTLAAASERKMNILKVLNTYDWFAEDALYKRPALCLMCKGEILETPEQIYRMDEIKVAVNKKYELTSREFIRRYFSCRSVDISVYAGGTEETVASGVNDFCIDVVYSGKSCSENRIQIAEKVRFSDIVLLGENPGILGTMIYEDYNQVMRRKMEPKEGSLTTNLLNDKKKRRDKIASECMELFSAIEQGKNIKGEIADVFYAINVVMAAEGILPRDLARELYGRMK